MWWRRRSPPRPIRGFEADDAARAVIREAGFGEFSPIAPDTTSQSRLHGSGAHLDNLETHDERRILPNTCFQSSREFICPSSACAAK
jgi:Xaa-Pro dipeptidase